MDKLNIEERVLSVLENIVLQGYDILAESSFDDMGLDSLDRIEFCMDIEDEFNLDIPDEVMEILATYGDIVKYVEQRLNSN